MAESTDSVLAVSQLGKRFGDRVAVDDVSFEVAPGETYGLLGPNGAGKTTTIRLVCGLLRADAGEVRVAGTPVGATSTAAKRSIGYVPQEIALYPDLTARENLQVGAEIKRPRALLRRSGGSVRRRVCSVRRSSMPMERPSIMRAASTPLRFE